MWGKLKGVEGLRGVEGASAKATYKIAPASLVDATVTGIKAKTYTGKGLTQAPTVTLGGAKLAKGVDYTMSYAENANAGTKTASVIISGTGNYTGSLTKKFAINKAANPLNVIAKTATVKRNKKKATTVAASKAYNFKKKGMGAVTYTRVAKGSSKWPPKVDAKKGAITVKAGAPKGSWKVKVKVAAKGNANYKSGSKTITVTVKVK